MPQLLREGVVGTGGGRGIGGAGAGIAPVAPDGIALRSHGCAGYTDRTHEALIESLCARSHELQTSPHVEGSIG